MNARVRAALQSRNKDMQKSAGFISWLGQAFGEGASTAATLLVAGIAGTAGLAGYAAGKITAKGTVDKENAEKEYHDARLSADMVGLEQKLRAEARMLQRENPAKKTARILG